MIRILVFLALVTSTSAQLSQIGSNPGKAPNKPHAQRGSHPWPMRNGDAARTGRSAAPGPTLGELDWTFRIAGVVPQFAAASDGTIHCGVVFHEAWWSNETYAYALTTDGRLEWRLKVDPWDWGFAQNVLGSPALDATEHVFVPAPRNRLYRLAPHGEIQWTKQGFVGTGNDSSPAVLPDQSVRQFVSVSTLLGLANNGDLQFQTNGIQSRALAVAVAANGEMALTGVRSSEPHGFPALYYFNADGTLRWQRDTTFGEESTPAIGDDGTVFAEYLGTTAFRPDNTILWSNPTSAVTRALGRNGVLYLASGTTLRLVDAATGTQLSSVPLPGQANEGLAIDADGNVYASTTNGYACGYAEDGTLLFESKLTEEFTTGPVIATDARIVLAGTEAFIHYVYAIR